MSHSYFQMGSVFTGVHLQVQCKYCSFNAITKKADFLGVLPLLAFFFFYFFLIVQSGENEWNEEE